MAGGDLAPGLLASWKGLPMIAEATIETTTTTVVDGDDWPAFVCSHCGEVVERPTNASVFDHRYKCEQAKIDIKRLNQQNKVEHMWEVWQAFEGLREHLRRWDRMEPADCAERAIVLEDRLHSGGCKTDFSWELQLWAYRKRAAGEKLFPYRKG